MSCFELMFSTFNLNTKRCFTVLILISLLYFRGIHFHYVEPRLLKQNIFIYHLRNGLCNTKFGLHYHHHLMNSISRYSFVLKLDMLFCSYAILYMNWTSRQDQSASIDLESVELTNRYTSCERCKGLHWRAYRQVWPSGRAHRSNKCAWYNCDCWWGYTAENVSWSNYFLIFGHHVIYDLLLMMMMVMMMMMILMTVNLSWQIDLRWSVYVYVYVMLKV